MCHGNVLEGRGDWSCRWGKETIVGVESVRGTVSEAGQAF